MNQYEQKKVALEKAMKEHVDAFQAIYDKAKDEKREVDTDERLEIESHVKALETLKTERRENDENLATVQRVNDLSRELGPAVDDAPRVKAYGEPLDRVFKSMGEMFTESANYKDLVNDYKQSGGRLRQGASSGAVTLDMKGTLLEGTGAAPGTGGALANPVPQVVPGVVDKLFQQLTVADLILSGQASGNSLRYVVEGTATSGAAGVAEAGLKPESTLNLSTVDEPLSKIATILPISDEMIEDAPAVQAYINGRLSLFVRIEEERQLLRGTGSSNEIRGIMPTGNARGINIYSGGTAAGNKAVQLFKAINGTRGSALVEPNFIVLSTSDWQDIRLLTDTAGQLFGGGPFVGPYGGPQGPVSTSGNQLNSSAVTIWDKMTVVTSALGSGTALVGNSASAQVWRRGGVSVEATNSHDDYFQRNLVAIRAEERLALAVYRPVAFTEVRPSVITEEGS